MTTAKCSWAGCSNDIHSSRLCEIHRFMWVPERYIHGAEPDAERIRSDGRVEWQIDNFWHLAHRLILCRELGRHLEHDEIVVHLDGDFTNNDRANLMLTNKSVAMKMAAERREEAKPKQVTVVTVELVWDDVSRDLRSDVQDRLDNGDLFDGIQDGYVGARVRSARVV